MLFSGENSRSWGLWVFRGRVPFIGVGAHRDGRSRISIVFIIRRDGGLKLTRRHLM